MYFHNLDSCKEYYDVYDILSQAYTSAFR